MKKKYINSALFSCLLLLLSPITHAQSWHWGKSGGGTSALPVDWETVKSTCTDIYGNVYTASDVSPNTLTVDGNPKTTYSNQFSTDILISSFSCEGNYRWSKVIGGINSDIVVRIASDNYGNVYTTGTVRPVDSPETAIHFDNDTILPSENHNLNTYNKSLFLVKYDSSGNMKWLRMPQATTIAITDYSITVPIDLQVDDAGNSYWMCKLPIGVYADGALTVATEGYYMLQYDTNGNYTTSTRLDFNTTPITSLQFRIKRNPNTGNIYVGGRFYTNEAQFGGAITSGGQTVSHTIFLIALNPDGSFLWKKENVSTGNYGLFDPRYDFTIDSDNSIYLTSSTGPVGGTDTSPDSINGIAFVPVGTLPSTPWPFITKFNPNGDTIWQTNGTKSSPCEVIVNGDEVAITGLIYDTVWQNLSYADSPGRHPYIARFNKETGTIIAINALHSTGFSDVGTALTKDSKGNYYMGGQFESTMTVGADNLSINGIDTDLYIAKFGSNNCDFLATVTPKKTNLEGYPNPVHDVYYVNNTQPCHYLLYGVLGNVVQSGKLETNGTINMSSFGSGMYVLEIDGIRIKLLKN